ncbi:CapA family protein [Spirochaeta cellobiosiphila]|uniref:CapA family protein n=1 Tax=Spirochaeta cellobiosiphila TaxID=504483 RepID=UPI00146D0D1E|nr:CapA family protein [Spirochaeta cellobiosiphila]
MKIKIYLIIVHIILLSWLLIHIDHRYKQKYYHPKTERKYQFTFAGDLMAHNVNFLMKNPYDIYEGISHITLNDDLSFINLETPINAHKPYQTYPLFNVHSEYIEPAIKSGFDVYSLANNHSTDQGIEGVIGTLNEMNRFSQKYNIYYNGLRYKKDSPYLPTTIDIDDLHIGFLSFTGFLNQWETKMGKDYVNLFTYRNSILNKDFLQYIQLISSNYDLFIVAFHGGIEYDSDPVDSKAKLFHDLIDNGVDIVWGHHPHVLQPWEVYWHNNQRKLIMYSTGNFISGQTWHLKSTDYDLKRARTGESALYQVSIEKQGSNYIIGDINVVPIANYKDPKKGMVVRTFDDLINNGLDEGWVNYYKVRLRKMQPLLKKTTSNEL